MSDKTSSISKKAGLPPGTLVHIGKKQSDDTKITVIDFNADEFEEKGFTNIADCFPYKEKSTISWINIDGLHDVNIISKLGEHYGLHHLLLEDVMNTGHRPKTEEFDSYTFVTLKMLGISKKGKNIVSEQISFVLGDTWLISFQEIQGDVFDGLRNRLKEGQGMTRKKGADYLLYRLIDTVVDNYFFVTEHFSEKIEALEEEVLLNPDDRKLHEIQTIKKELVQLRKDVIPVREAISTLTKEGNPLVKKGTIRYLQDVYEHVIQVIDNIETLRDAISNVMDLYMTGVSNKMNQVMQVLTIMASIFIPLTFIAGIYGMNFDNIPELHFKYGYHTVWVVMIIIIGIMLGYFKRKKWL